MNDEFQKWVREHAEHYLKSKSLDFEVVQCQIDDAFKDFIARNYLCPLTRLREEYASGHGQTLAELGRRYGVHAGTITRWLDGDPDVKISHLSIVYAAENARFRSGNRIAVDSYVYAVQKVCELVGRPLAVNSPLSTDGLCDLEDEEDRIDFFDSTLREEALVLYHTFRCPEWWEAKRQRSPSGLRTGAEFIAHGTGEYVSCQQSWDIEDIQKLMRSWFDDWSVIEAVLPYEWF